MILVPSAVRAVSGNVVVAQSSTYAAGATAVDKLAPVSRWRGGVALLNVTAAATGAGDTLDVYFQSSIDDGTTFDDFIHFTQVLGNGGAKKHLASWISNATVTVGMKQAQDAAIAAGVAQGPVGGIWRVKWVVVGGTASFTFSVSFEPLIDDGR